jgi:hypothetical protein
MSLRPGTVGLQLQAARLEPLFGCFCTRVRACAISPTAMRLPAGRGICEVALAQRLVPSPFRIDVCVVLQLSLALVLV